MLGLIHGIFLEPNLMSSDRPHIIVVGAGLSGLAASLEVERLGGSVTILERTNAIGGRVKTDLVNGFLLDHGFQVLLTSYPELKRLHILNSLNLRAFQSGAVCHRDHITYSLINPLRHLLQFLANIHKLPLATYLDFLKLARIVFSSATLSGSTSQLLQNRGISFDTRHDFLEPFFGGVFLDTTLDARAQIFTEYLRLFLKGVATLPEKGMQALPKAIYSKLKNTRVKFGKEVKDIAEGRVFLENGNQIIGDAVIVSVDNPSLELWVEKSKEIGSKSVCCLYFSIPQGKIKKSPSLHLGNDGPITNLCIPNHIQPGYAPKGFDLISATVVSPKWQQKTNLVSSVKENISSWFSISEKSLHLLKSYHIKHALPFQKEPPILENKIKIKEFKRVFLAGEMVQPPSINGALVSGKNAGNAAITSIKHDL